MTYMDSVLEFVHDFPQEVMRKLDETFSFGAFQSGFVWIQIFFQHYSNFEHLTTN